VHVDTSFRKYSCVRQRYRSHFASFFRFFFPAFFHSLLSSFSFHLLSVHFHLSFFLLFYNYIISFMKSIHFSFFLSCGFLAFILSFFTLLRLHFLPHILPLFHFPTVLSTFIPSFVIAVRHPQHTQTSSNSSTIAADSSNGVTNTRCCRYSCLRS